MDSNACPRGANQNRQQRKFVLRLAAGCLDPVFRFFFKDDQGVRNGADPVAPQAHPCPEQASARSCGAKHLAARRRIRLPRRFAFDNQFVPVEGQRGVLHVVTPPPLFPSELLPCPAAANRARRLRSNPEDTRGKIAAGAANPGASAGAGTGAGAGAGAAGVLLECCVTVPTKRCPSSSKSQIAVV